MWTEANQQTLRKRSHHAEWGERYNLLSRSSFRYQNAFYGNWNRQQEVEMSAFLTS
jgi:hypothetical protein